MELGRGIEVPVNYAELESENAAAGCLDLLKDLGSSGVVQGPERLLCNIDPFERWGQFPGSVTRDAAGSSLQFHIASGSGSFQQASQLTRQMQMNGEVISQSGSQCVDSFCWANRGVSSGETMIQFTPTTPHRNKPVVGNRQTDDGVEEGIANKKTRQEISNLGGVTGNNPNHTGVAHCNPSFMFFGEPSLSLGTRISQNADSQFMVNNVYVDSSAPVTPDKWKTIVQKIPTGKDDLFCSERIEGNGQKISHGIAGLTSEVVLDLPSQQESQKQIVGEGLDANHQESTPRQKARRRKHRPKVVIEGKPQKQQKPKTPRPVSTPEIPRVKRKYVRKEKKNLPETTPGVECERDGTTKTAPPSAKRVLNFDVQETQSESVLENLVAQSEGNADAQQKPSSEANIHGTSNDHGSKCEVVSQHKESDDSHSQLNNISIDSASEMACNRAASNGCAIRFIPPSAFTSPEGVADPSARTASDLCRPINQVVDEFKYQGHSIRIIPPSRRNMLRENLKVLARDRDNLEFQRAASGIFAQGITKKRSKRDRISPTASTRRSIEMWNGFGEITNGGMHNSSSVLPATFIPEQCKKKRTKVATSEKASNVAANTSPSPVPSSSNQSPSLDSGQKNVACLPSENAARNPSLSNQAPSLDSGQKNVAFLPSEQTARSDQTGLKIKFTMSSQAQKQDLIAQANAACFMQIPIIPRSAIVCYRTPVFDGKRAVNEVTAPKPPRKRRAKKGRTPEANGMPLCLPPCQERAPFMLYPAYFSQANIRELVELLGHRLVHLSIDDMPKGIVPQSLQQENAIVPYYGGGAMVPFDNMSVTRKKKPRAKVDLDNETNRVWLLLMGLPSLNAPDGTDAEKEKWWEEERRVFRGRADSFIARMHLIQGDRRFSPWKGSVVDSVIGVFLTQNVSDHLSSSAYMNLASRFPIASTVVRDEMKMSPEKEDAYLVEFDEYVKEEEIKVPRPESSQNMRVVAIKDEDNVEGKEIFHDIRSHGEDAGSGAVACSNSPVEEVTGAQLTTESANLEECTTSLESTFGGVNSVASSQNSSNSPIQMNTNASTPLQSHCNMPHLTDARTHYGLSGSTSFTELLHLAGSNMLHLSSDFATDEKEETVDDHIYKPDVCSSLGGHDPYLQLQLNDATQVSVVSSTTEIYCGVHHETESENANVSRETHSASAVCEVDDKLNLEASCISPITKKANDGTCQEASVAQSTSSCDSHTKIRCRFDGFLGEVRSEQQSCNHISPPAPFDRCTDDFQHIYSSKDIPGAGSKESSSQMSSFEAHGPQVGSHPLSCASDGSKSFCTARPEEKMPAMIVADTKDESFSAGISNAGKTRRKRVEKAPSEPIDWDILRKRACCKKIKKERSKETTDSVDWEAVKRADVSEIADAIRERGMNNRLAQRIKEFLDRVVKDHGSIDLEWLRDVPPDQVKDYLLSIKGLGLKSVECVRLLTLHHLAFPVDTNVGRICVRLGWVPLQPLPESLQLHLLELYPVLETIQKYLWPRLCKLDQRTLYELHYQMITFGKVFCTKSKPNCNACPMKGECRHFASAFASARLALPGPEEKGLVVSTAPTTSTSEPQPNAMPMPLPLPLPQLEDKPLHEERVRTDCEPIIEEPASPESECLEVPDIEDFGYEDPDEIPTIKLNIQKFAENLHTIMQINNMELPEGDISKALVALTPEAASIPQPMLKNVGRLRTEHLVYEIPDSHPLAEGLDRREADDPSPYLVAIWSPGETAQSTELPEASCSSRTTGVLCDKETCSSCNGIRETRAQIVRGTLLIPCRTAMRGRFPLNGTYFQVNEVFADHSSSINPITIPRQWMWNLPRRTVYFGTTVTTLFKGLGTEAIQQGFWRGYVCVRGFDRETRAPRPLSARLHLAASKMPPKNKNKNATMQEKRGQ